MVQRDFRSPFARADQSPATSIEAFIAGHVVKLFSRAMNAEKVLHHRLFGMHPQPCSVHE
jgi:hypothetical protein